MKFPIALFLLALPLSPAFASTPDIDTAISNLHTALQFSDLPYQQRQGLQQIEAQLRDAVAKGNCGVAAAQPKITYSCVALSTATGEERGRGEASSTTQEGALADAQDAALANCKATAKYPTDCEYIRQAKSYDCHVE